jgi:fructose-bisphosphate aldolase, class I
MGAPFQNLKDTIAHFTSNGQKGILAADESIGTIGKRFAKNSIESTFESRRLYRELLITTPLVEQFISGVILSDETIHQSTSEGTPFAEILEKKNIIAGIKVDKGTVPLSFFPGENVTEGLDNLHDRLTQYKRLGARFAKWRAIIKIGKEIPSMHCLHTNAQVIARYASICQELDIVPIVEPEILMDGNHSIEQCEKMTIATLETVFHSLFQAGVSFEYLILKPNMVLPGTDSTQKVSAQIIANKTLSALSTTVPSAVPMIAFLSGGQSAKDAAKNLNSICSLATRFKPWFLTFSFSRALQEQPLSLWGGKGEKKEKAQELFLHRVKCSSAAVQSLYNESMESEL